MEELAFFDPLILKNPIGVIVKGNTVQFRVKTISSCIPNEVYFMLKSDNEVDYQYFLMEKTDNYFFIENYFKNSGHYWYNFKLNYDNFSKYLSKNYNYSSIISNNKGEDFFQSVIEKDYDCNNSLQGGLIYHIFVDRFCKEGKIKSREPLILRNDWGGKIKQFNTNPEILNREVFGGNLKGIISKLDYIKELGVTTIYLSPICLANSNHKYDTADYFKIDSMFGTDYDFEKLINESKKRNIKIIIDAVYNHTGSDSIYFNKDKNFESLGAYNSKESIYYNWYDFYEFPQKYSCWWGIKTLPSIKKDSYNFQKYIAGDGGVIEKYMNMGIFGIRIDVVDELSNSFIDKISKKISSFGKDKVIMGEVWEDAATKISYSERKKYFCNNQLNSIMNYPIKEAIINYIKTKEPNELNSTIRMIINNYPEKVINNLMNFLGTHDTNRIFTEINNITNNNIDLTEKLLKIAFGILFTLPGVPSLFYGDEYGIENNDGSSRNCFDWNNYNNEIFCYVKSLSKIRDYDVLKNGKIKILYHSNGKFIYERYNKQEQIIVAINLRPSQITINFEGDFISFFDKKIVNECVLSENELYIFINKKKF